MRKLITITLLLLLITPCLRAQRKELSQARSYIKSGKDLNKAEDLMTGLLAADSANRENPKIYHTWYQAVRKQYDIENEKLYLKQDCDTSKIYSLTKKMLDIVFALDSVDAKPDEKGRVKPKYRKDNAEEMHTLRPNLYYGGLFCINKADYNTAFTYLDTYINSKDMPLFESYDYATNDTTLIDAAYWATFCGYKTEDAEKTLKHAKLALEDKNRRMFTLSYMAEAYILLGDEESLITTLHIGFEEYPLHPYFFPRLMDYYTVKGETEIALSIVNDALAVDSLNELFLFVKSSVLLNMKRYQECIEVSDSLIAVNDTVAEAYFNAGMSWYNQAKQMEQTPIAASSTLTAKERRALAAEKKELVSGLYRNAMPYLERYRQLAPKASDKWAPSLYQIYLNLNMGKQFDEIDAILRKRK